MRDIAEVIGRGLNVPVVALSPAKAAAQFGRLARFAAADMSASNAKTQERLGWRPTGPKLIADLEQMRYQNGIRTASRVGNRLGWSVLYAGRGKRIGTSLCV